MNGRNLGKKISGTSHEELYFDTDEEILKDFYELDSGSCQDEDNNNTSSTTSKNNTSDATISVKFSQKLHSDVYKNTQAKKPVKQKPTKSPAPTKSSAPAKSSSPQSKIIAFLTHIETTLKKSRLFNKLSDKNPKFESALGVLIGIIIALSSVAVIVFVASVLFGQLGTWTGGYYCWDKRHDTVSHITNPNETVECPYNYQKVLESRESFCKRVTTHSITRELNEEKYQECLVSNDGKAGTKST